MRSVIMNSCRTYQKHYFLTLVPNTVKTPQTFLTENNFFCYCRHNRSFSQPETRTHRSNTNYNLKETRTAMPLPKQNDSSSVDHKENKLELLCVLMSIFWPHLKFSLQIKPCRHYIKSC